MPGINLECKNLEKNYLGKTVFKNINLNLNSGDSLVITGKNGSGKSTLVKIISHLIKQSKGEINLTVENNKIEKENFYKYTGMLAPYINLYDELTAYENLSFFYKLKSDTSKEISKKELSELIDVHLEMVNLFKRKNDLVKNYSSGMKQRVKLAFAVINKPPLLILDEPRTNLDNEGIDIVYKSAEEHIKRGILIVATNEKEDFRLGKEIINLENFKK